MTKSDRPNVLILFADQMRGDFLGCAGHPVVKTPTIDRLSDEGVRFPNAYSPDPICVPARASLVTGNYPFRCTGTKTNGGRIKDDQPKMPEVFSRAGYQTYAAGKLHFVPYSPPGEPRLLHGFQQAAIMEEGRILKQYAPHSDMDGLEDYHDYLKTVGWAGYERAHGVGNNDIHPSPSPLPKEHYVDAWVADRTIAYLRQHSERNLNSPFFLFAGFPRPHAPYDPPRPYDTMYDPRDVPAPLTTADERKRTPTKEVERISRAWDRFPPQMTQLARAYYMAQISFQDEQIGRIISFLEETGELEQTIVVYTADHGDLMGDFGYFGKQSFYRGSVNIPFIIRMPGSRPAEFSADSTSQALVGLQDIFPTLASVCGIGAEKGAGLEQVDGIDLSPLLTGSQFAGRQWIVSTCGDDPRQLFMVADQKWKYCYSQVGGVEELYDMENDPGELENRAQLPGSAPVIDTMRERLRSWLAEMGDTSVIAGPDLAANEEPIIEKAAFDGSRMGWRWY